MPVQVSLPYFDQILELVDRQPDSALAVAFRRHVHWGCFDQPDLADDSLEGYVQAAEGMTRRIVDAAGMVDGTRIIDVGCGFGGTIDHLDERLDRCELVGSEHRPASAGQSPSARHPPTPEHRGLRGR